MNIFPDCLKALCLLSEVLHLGDFRRCFVEVSKLLQAKHI